MRCTQRWALACVLAWTLGPVAAGTLADPPPLPDLVNPTGTAGSPSGSGALQAPGGVKNVEDLPLPPPPADLLGAQEPTPVPSKEKFVPQSAPSPTPTSVPEPAATPTALPAKEASAPTEAKPTATAASAASPVTSAPVEAPQGFAAYFPAQVGQKWRYKSDAGVIREVECLARTDDPAGGTKITLKTTEGGTPVETTWILLGSKVTLAEDAQGLRKGWILLQDAKPSSVPRWSFARKDGVVSYYKAEAGVTEAGGKPGVKSITVTERTISGPLAGSRRWVYSWGVGLEAEEDLDPAGKPIAGKTYKLTAP